MDAFVNKVPEVPRTTQNATVSGLTLSFLASQIKAISVSTQKIEYDTREIKATVEDIEGTTRTLSSHMDKARSLH